jgi:hypothetical protein
MWMGIILPLLINFGPQSKQKSMSFQITIMRIALLTYTLGYTCFFFAETELQFYMIGFADGFGAVCLPIARGIISHSSIGGQGVLFSTIALIQQFGAIVDPVVYGGVYRATLGFAPGFVFLLAAFFCLVGFCFTAGLDRKELVVKVREGEGEEESGVLIEGGEVDEAEA